MADFLRRLLGGEKKVPDNAAPGRTVKAACATGSAARVAGIRSGQFGSVASQKGGWTDQERDTWSRFIGKTVGGSYQIRGLLGHGNMGVVFRAYSPMLDREVALKVPFRKLFADENNRARVLREAKATAQLQHGNIVRVFDAREHGQCFYIVSELIEGQTLEQKVTQQTLPVRETALIVRKLAEALAHAHSRGIIHRDVKPGNIMLDRQNEPMLTDFGLARIAESESQLTRDGTVMGTPAYMSPEQVLGRQELVGPATDQYSLGAVLYRLLCGQLPFSADFPAIMQQVLHEEPPTPRSLNPQISIDLEVICLKAMAKEPEHRYTSCQELADDLRRWSEGHPIQARRIGPVERLYRWSRRNPITAGLVVTAMLLLLAVAIVAEIGSIHTSRALTQAEAERSRAEGALKAEAVERQQRKKTERRTEQSLYNARMTLAQKRYSAGEVEEAERLLDACPTYLRHWEWAYLKRLWRLNSAGRAVIGTSQNGTGETGTSTSQEPVTLRGHKNSVLSVSFSPDGTQIVTGSEDETVRVWNLATGQESLTLSHGPIATLSPDGKRTVTSDEQHGVRVWNTITGQELLSFSKSPVKCVAYSPNGKRIAGGTNIGTWREVLVEGRTNTEVAPEGGVYIWDSATGKEILTLRGETEADVSCVAFSPDGKEIVGGAGLCTMVWDADSGKRTIGLHGHGGYVRSVTFSPDGKAVMSGSDDRTIRVCNAATGQEILCLYGHSGPVRSVGFSPDGKRIVSGSEDGTVKIWDVTVGQELLTIQGHSKAITVVAFSPDGKHIASGSEDGTVTVWDGTADIGYSTLWGHTASVMRVAFSTDGRQIISGALNGTVKMWDANTLQETLTIQGPGASVSNLAFSADLKRVIRIIESFSAGGNALSERVQVWDVATGQEAFALGPKLHHVSCVACSPDGRRVVSGGFIGDVIGMTFRDEKVWGHFASLCAWDTTNGREVFTIRGDKGEVECMAFSPDGTRIATNTGILDATCGKDILPLDVCGCTSIAFSKDGGRIVCGSGDGYISIVDASSGETILAFEAHKGYVFSVAFNSDGKQIVSASADAKVRVWDAAVGQELHTYVGHRGQVYSAAFSPDGKRIVSGSADKTVRLWEATDLQ